MCDIKYLLEWMKAIHPCLPSRFPDRLHLQTAQARRSPSPARSRFNGSSAVAQGGRQPGRAPWGWELPSRGTLRAGTFPQLWFATNRNDFGTAPQSILPIAPTSPVLGRAVRHVAGSSLQTQGPPAAPTFPGPDPPPSPLTPAPAQPRLQPRQPLSAASRSPPH